MSARLAIAEVSNNNTMRDFQSNPTSFLKSNTISSFLETVRHVHRNFFLTKPDSYHTDTENESNVPKRACPQVLRLNFDCVDVHRGRLAL